jgi:hypothetical protein
MFFNQGEDPLKECRCTLRCGIWVQPPQVTSTFAGPIVTMAEYADLLIRILQTLKYSDRIRGKVEYIQTPPGLGIPKLAPNRDERIANPRMNLQFRSRFDSVTRRARNIELCDRSSKILLVSKICKPEGIDISGELL